MKTYFVPMKEDVEGYGGHIMFLPNMLGGYFIFKCNTYPNTKPSQSEIGFIDFELNEDVITQWCNNFFKEPKKHPAIYEFDTKTMQQRLLMDNYIEDFVNENYDEIIRKLNDKTRSGDG